MAWAQNVLGFEMFFIKPKFHSIDRHLLSTNCLPRTRQIPEETMRVPKEKAQTRPCRRGCAV